MNRKVPVFCRRRLVASSAGVLVLACAALAQAAGAKVEPGLFKGKTSVGTPVAVNIAHHKIKSLSATDAYNRTCGAASSPNRTIYVTNVKVAANGTFSVHVRLMAFVGGESGHEGEVSGKVSGKIVTGKIDDLTQESRTECPDAFDETFTAHKT